VATSKQRREAERRRLQRQMQRRSQREARRRRVLTLVSVLGVLVVVAAVVLVVALSSDEKSSKPKAGGGAGPSSTPSTSASTSPSPSPTGRTAACAWTKVKGAARAVKQPPATVSRKGTVTVAVTTNRGPLTFTLDRTKTPCTVASFVSLAGQKYYDGTSCHRLTSGSLSVLQCGDPLGTGAGGPGYQFKDELSGSEKYTRGVLAMANSGPNTNGSQFFIVYKDSQLPPSYTVFGTVTKGLNVVDKVAAAGSVTAGDGKPKLPITLQKVTVTQ
jgi:peptidyl-prolyl cis-trans isomerase B (cyclophilin B)